jgi:processive 1,2-diacylglycerol beta-glucosyltransferase
MDVNVIMKEKILILIDRHGDGHFKAAQAIQQAIRLSYPQAEAMVADFMKLAHPYSYPFTRSLFLKGIQKLPSLYGYFFQKTYHHHSSCWAHAFMKLGLKRMTLWLEQVQPSVVVSTSPLAAITMSIMKAQGLTVPTATVITDHSSHGFWVQPHTDLYLVSSDFVRQALIRLGISHSRIAVTGIPIRLEFCRNYSRKGLIEKYQLNPNLPTILVMGGGWGMLGNEKSFLEPFNHLPKICQFIIVCGHNRKLKRNLAKQIPHSKHPILLTGYVENIHELMKIADLMITKAGGLTTAEAMALGLPMLLYKSLPGQEQENTRFLLDTGVARQADNATDLTLQISNLLKNPELLFKMKKKAQHLQSKQSAFLAAEMILSLRHSSSFLFERMNLDHTEKSHPVCRSKEILNRNEKDSSCFNTPPA